VTALLSDEPVVALKQAVDRCTTPEPAVLARMLTAADREPETVELNREGFLVNEQPSLDHLRDGFFAPSLDLDVIETEFWAWLERDVFPRGTRTSGRVPMFWLVGPSGAGKSILLLQLLARLGTNAGVSVLLRDRQHEPLPTVAKRARRLSHRRLTIVGLDDPLSFTFGSEEPTWAEAFAVLRGTRMTSGRGLVIFVGTATIERLHIFRQRVAGETQLATHTLQPYRTEFVDHLRDWYHRRTDRETPAARDSDAIMLPAQLFFEWWKGEGVHEFASRFRNRISGYRLPELSSFFDRLLAVNRLYVGVPPGALSQLSANVRDAIRILVEDMHLTHNPIGRPGFWLSHPQLANAVYECWFTPGLHEEQRTEHLAAALADAIKVHVEGWGSIPLLTRLLEEGSEGATLGGRLGPTERQAALREAGEIAGAARADLALPVLAAWVDVDHQRPGLLSWRPAEEAVSRLTVARPFDLGLNALIQTLARVQDEAGIIAAWDFLAAHPDYYGWIALATQLLADHPIADSHADTLRSVIADRSDDPEVFALLLHSLDHPSPHPLLVGMARDLLVTNPDRDGYQELATRLYRLGGDNRNAALTWLGRVRKANGVVLNEIMKRPQPVLTAWDAMSRWLEVYPLEPESDAGFAAVTNWRRWSEERIEMVDGSGVQVFPFQRSLGLHLSDRDTHVSDALMSTIRSMLETFSQSNWTWLYLQLTPHQVRQPEMYELALRWLRGRRSSNAWHHAFDHLCSAFTDEPREELAAVGRDQIDLAWSYPLCARLLGWVLRNSPPNHRESDVGRVLAWLNENQGGADEWGYLFPQVVTASQGPIRRTALERGLAWWREHWDVGAPASYVLRALLRGALEADAVEMVKIVVAEATRWLETKHEGWGHVFLDIQPHLSESDALRLALIFLQAEPASDRWAAVLASIIDNLEPAQIKTLAILWFDRGNGIDSTAGFIWAVVVVKRPGFDAPSVMCERPVGRHGFVHSSRPRARRVGVGRGGA